MAMALARECIFPQDLESAAHKMQQELNDRFQNNLALLNAVKPSIPEVDSLITRGNNLLSQLLANGDGSSNIKTLDDLSTQFGLPKEPPTQEDNERSLFYAGMVLVNGVLYVNGVKSPVGPDRDNIAVLRRIYFSTGRSLSKVESFLNQKSSFPVHLSINFFNLAPAAPQTPLTLDQIRAQTNLNYLTTDDYSVNLDSSVTILNYNYLTFGQSLTQTQAQFNIPSSQIVSSVFHFNRVDNSTPSTNKFRNYGYSGDELTAILSGQDLAKLSSNPIKTGIDNSKSQATAIVSSLNFIITRYNTLSNSNLVNLQSTILQQLNSLYDYFLSVFVEYLFRVTIIKQLDTLTKLRQRNTDADIVYLLERRQEVQGIYFGASDDIYAREIGEAISADPGSTTVSNKFLNASANTSTIDQRTLIRMIGDIQAARNAIQASFTEESIGNAKAYLIDFGATSPFVTPSANKPILQGQPNTASPASLMVQYVSFSTTFELNLRIAAIDDALAGLNRFYTDNIAKPLARVIDIVTGFFESAMNMCKQLIADAKGAIMPLKNRLDAFMSKYLSLTGSGVFKSSLLSCAINFNIGLSSGILDDLLALLDEIANAVGKFFKDLAKWLADLLKQLLCMPFDLLNSFLGGIQTSLPSACQLPKIDLGTDLTSALVRLRNVGAMKNAVFSGMSRDLVRFRALVKSAPDKLNQFNNDACGSGSTADFYNASILNIETGLGAPTASLGSVF